MKLEDSLLYELEEIVKEMEKARRQQHYSVLEGQGDQAWGICRVYARCIATDGEFSESGRTRFDTLEIRRKEAVAGAYNDVWGDRHK